MVEFDLFKDSLEDLFVSKMSSDRVRSLKDLCEAADLPWLWSAGKSVFDMGVNISPSDYLVRFMDSYYEKISNEEIVLGDKAEETIFTIPTRCRGSSKYSSELISKKENLLDWIENGYEKSNIILATFTLSSNRVSDIKESFDRFRGAVNHIISKITQQQHLGRRPTYLWAIEPHQSGYPHLHMVFFENFIPNFEEIASWWVENYTEGRADKQGVDWEKISRTQGRKRVAQDIAKYVVKNLSFESFENEEGVEDKKQISRDRRLMWLGMLWFSGRRSWSYSRFLGEVMSGLVKRRTDSMDSFLFRLVGFEIYPSEYVYLGHFSDSEIEKLKDSGNFNFAYLFEDRYGVSEGSSDSEGSSSIGSEERLFTLRLENLSVLSSLLGAADNNP